MSHQKTEHPLYLNSAIELAKKIANGETTSKAVTQLFLARIKQYAALNAFSCVCELRALALAESADRLQASGLRLSPLHGVPVTVKEHFQWVGTVAHYGSKSRAHEVSQTSSALVNKLIGLGMIVLGKTSMTEFAFGLSGQNPLLGTAKNPWHATEHRAPGGSSAGAGVAVAAGLCPLALGGDSGGSVRAPASLTHTVGYKPSSGLLSRSDCMPLSETLDVIGAIAHTVADVRLITQLLAESDSADSQTMQPEAQVCQAELIANKVFTTDNTLYYLEESAWPIQLKPDAYANWQATLELLQNKGWQLKAWQPKEAGFFAELGRLNSVVLAYEAYQVQGHYAEDSTAEMWEVVRNRILNGKNISSENYQQALTSREHMQATFKTEFTDQQVLLMPAVDQGAQLLDDADANHSGLGQLLRPINFLGSPAINLPTDCDCEGMPLAVQLLAYEYEDTLLLTVAEQLEAILPDTRLAPSGF